MFEAHLKSFKLAVAMGVKIGSGCDAFSDPVTAFGPYNLREIELLQEAGLSSLDALRAATASNAELLGLDADVGALEPGRFADVLRRERRPHGERGSAHEFRQPVPGDAGRARAAAPERLRAAPAVS